MQTSLKRMEYLLRNVDSSVHFARVELEKVSDTLTKKEDQSAKSTTRRVKKSTKADASEDSIGEINAVIFEGKIYIQVKNSFDDRRLVNLETGTWITVKLTDKDQLIPVKFPIPRYVFPSK